MFQRTRSLYIQARIHLNIYCSNHGGDEKKAHSKAVLRNKFSGSHFAIPVPYCNRECMHDLVSVYLTLERNYF